MGHGVASSLASFKMVVKMPPSWTYEKVQI